MLFSKKVSLSIIAILFSCIALMVIVAILPSSPQPQNTIRTAPAICKAWYDCDREAWNVSSWEYTNEEIRLATAGEWLRQKYPQETNTWHKNGAYLLRSCVNGIYHRYDDLERITVLFERCENNLTP